MYRPATADASSGVEPVWRAFMYAAYQSPPVVGWGDGLEGAVAQSGLLQELGESRDVHD
jgi:hypothetical protein